MPELTPPQTAIRGYSDAVQAALDLVELLLLEALKHGYFDYSVSCELGTNGRRLLIVKAGKSHKFSIEETDVPR